LKELLGKGRAKLGMFEGNLDDGELEIGQVSSYIRKILPVSKIMEEMINEFREVSSQISNSDKYKF